MGGSRWNTPKPMSLPYSSCELWLFPSHSDQQKAKATMQRARKGVDLPFPRWGTQDGLWDVWGGKGKDVRSGLGLGEVTSCTEAGPAQPGPTQTHHNSVSATTCCLVEWPFLEVAWPVPFSWAPWFTLAFP